MHTHTYEYVQIYTYIFTDVWKQDLKGRVLTLTHVHICIHTYVYVQIFTHKYAQLFGNKISADALRDFDTWAYMHTHV